MSSNFPNILTAKAKRNWQVPYSAKFVIAYLVLVAIPFLATFTVNMQDKTLYATFMSALNTLAMMAFYLEFPLTARIQRNPLFPDINWNMLIHKRIGQVIGLIFFLHPLVILAPRFFVSFDDGMRSMVQTLQAPQMLTGIIAWLTLLVLVLLAVFKKQLGMRYELWRLSHILGFVAVAILATLHITSVGSHGQLASGFNALWWGLCLLALAGVVFHYLIKPYTLRKHPFTLVDIRSVSTSDYHLVLEKPAHSNFRFKAGQFVWLNQSYNGLSDHPFSIASAPSDLPRISFLIRNLGDYTATLKNLKIGQKMYVDGPYGSISLKQAKHRKAIMLIAGGAGIGAMLSLLKTLAERKDPRPIRLIYGNKSFEQMALQDEIKDLELSMPNFKQQLVCQQECADHDVYRGLITQSIISRTMGVLEKDAIKIDDWVFYLCGPEAMDNGINRSLQNLGVNKADIHFERLSF